MMANSAAITSSTQPVRMSPWLALAIILFLAGGSHLTRIDVRLGLLWNILIGSAYTSALVRWLYLRSRLSKTTAVAWPRSMLLLGSAAAVITAQLVVGSVLGLVAETCEVTWPIEMYITFLGPVAVGAVVTLFILAWIESGGINPMIDQYFGTIMGSRTYREIQAERKSKEQPSPPPSETRTQ